MVVLYEGYSNLFPIISGVLTTLWSVRRKGWVAPRPQIKKKLPQSTKEKKSPPGEKRWERASCSENVETNDMYQRSSLRDICNTSPSLYPIYTNEEVHHMLSNTFDLFFSSIFAVPKSFFLFFVSRRLGERFERRNVFKQYDHPSAFPLWLAIREIMPCWVRKIWQHLQYV